MPDLPTGPEGGRLVLVVEDEPAIADLLVLHLRHAGFRAAVARDGATALQDIERLRPEVVLLDIGLPGMDGIEVCRVLRSRGDWTPVLFVTARDDHVDRVVGLELGADDYVTKPFSPREVIARIRAILRRVDGPAARADQTHSHAEGPQPASGRHPGGDPQTLRHGAVVCLPAERRVLVDGADVALTATEFDLLAHLLGAPGRVHTRPQLLRAVWGHTSIAGERTVDVHVAQVRAKLAPHDPIRTVRGVGYAAWPP